MWSYYGSKSDIADIYPPPKYGLIIEPFAGAAKYSMLHWQKKVLLIDKYQLIVELWIYLQQVTEMRLKWLPDLEDFKQGDKFQDIKGVTSIERKLMSFSFGRGDTSARNSMSVTNNWKRDKQRYIENIHKIRHWVIKLGDYKQLDDREATWFIDPPYQFGGEHYVHGNKDIDFVNLAKWCMSRRGQVMVCENSKADWMEFIPIKKISGQQFKTTEVIWTNEKTHFDNKQLTLEL